jgi:hypothetical protein
LSFLPTTHLAFSARRLWAAGADAPPTRAMPDREGRFRMAAPQKNAVRAVLGRLTWLFFGPILLAFVTVVIATRHEGGFSFSDLVFFLVLGAVLAGRWLEFRSGDPRTATGEPATLQHLHRYTVALTGIGLVVWGAATLLRVFRLSG